MSIKAYDGFRMVSKDFRQVLRDLEGVSVRIQQHNRARMARLLARLAVGQIDRGALKLPSEAEGTGATHSRGPLSAAFATMMDRQEKIRVTRHRDPAVDFEVTFTLWHCRRLDNYIGVVAAESKEPRELLLASRVAREYGYWNNTDKPENLSDREWANRASAWGECLYDKSGPSFRIEVPEPGLPTVDDVVQHLPTLEERVKAQAEDVAFAAWLARHEEVAKEGAESVLRACFRFHRHSRQEGSEEAGELARARMQVAAQLPATITREMLLG
ncbi:hypothetical protein D3C71_20310 [compost metagenome]